TSAVGGGAIRDVLAREVPVLLRWDREIYAVPALFGAALIALLVKTDTVNAVTATAAAVLAFALRVLALHKGWRAPRAWRRDSGADESFD
ncbi:MAG TPA: TRIC cation channel family protein, partial [Yinghuangia sp.]|nr:TRIC cation channel family protein [Yinghuangia sp.]